MLYITTGNPADSFTSHRVLREDRASDGGMFIPMQMPVITKEQITAMKEGTFADVAAQVLNLFFDNIINGWDVGFSVGRSPIKVQTANHRLAFAQLWHNHGGAYSYLERNIYHKLTGIATENIPQWPKIAIRIAVLFGVHIELVKNGIHKYDIAVSADDIHLPIAVVYAKKMGLPIENVICGCNENSGFWDLIHRGEFNTVSLSADNLYAVERLIFDIYGREEAARYRSVVQHCGIYKLSEKDQQAISADMFISVLSNDRVESIIRSVCAAELDFETATAYGALQDFRAKTGESKYTLILADKSPTADN